MADPISTLMTLVELSKKTDPNEKLREKADINPDLKMLSGLALLKDRLKQVQELKNKYPSETNTGPYISKLWDPSGSYDQGGSPKAPSLIQGLYQSIIANPEKNSVRNDFMSKLKLAQQFGFNLGGGNLTGGEAAKANQYVPSQFLDDKEFSDKLNTSINQDIPTALKSQIRKLVGLGYSEEQIMKIIGEQQ